MAIERRRKETENIRVPPFSLVPFCSLLLMAISAVTENLPRSRTEKKKKSAVSGQIPRFNNVSRPLGVKLAPGCEVGPWL
jgi:hypothetical protein